MQFSGRGEGLQVTTTLWAVKIGSGSKRTGLRRMNGGAASYNIWDENVSAKVNTVRSLKPQSPLKHRGVYFDRGGEPDSPSTDCISAEI